MSIDGPTILAILVMALLTYATRVAGFALIRRVPLSPSTRQALDTVPGAVLVALVAPAILAHGLADALAGLVTVLAALRLPLAAVVAIGVLAAGLLRATLGPG